MNSWDWVEELIDQKRKIEMELPEDAEQQLDWNLYSWQSFQPIIDVTFDSILTYQR